MASRTVSLSAGTSMAFLTAVAAFAMYFHGLPNRLDARAALMNEAVGTHYRCPVSEYMKLGLNRACPMNLPSRNPADADVVLLGNSHAQMYAPILTSILKEHNNRGILVPFNTCLPTMQANFNQECNDVAARNLATVLSLPAHTVVLAFTWWHDDLVDPMGHRIDNRDTRALVEALDDLVSKIRASGKQVILVGPIAKPGWDVATVISREIAFGWPEAHQDYMPETDFMKRFGNAIKHFESDQDIRFVPAFAVQCHDNRCGYVMDGRSLYSDETHLAVSALPRYKRMFEAALYGE